MYAIRSYYEAEIQALLDNLVTNGQAMAATLFITCPDGSVLPIGDKANAPLFTWHDYTPRNNFV